MLISLTVGKVDAGVAVLLTEDKRLIEFPSILLPPSISSGSIVDITVSRNHDSEASSQTAFLALQNSIFTTYGQASPSPPLLRCRNATQTSVVLEWDPIALATASIRSLSLYRNGSKAGSIPRPLDLTSTKISGLAVDTEYVFHLVLRTSAGQYSSEKLAVRTHKMTDLSGITVTPGVLPAALRESLSGAVERIGGKMVENVRIDTTHFVCTEGRGREWERALEMNIPVVRPEWVEGCEREGRIVGVRGYYLNADPKLRQVGPGVGIQQQQQQQPQMRARTESQQAAGPVRQASQQGGFASPSSATNGLPLRQGSSVAPPTPPAKDAPKQSQEVNSPTDANHDAEQAEHETDQESEPATYSSRNSTNDRGRPSVEPGAGKEGEGEGHTKGGVDGEGKAPGSPEGSGTFSVVQL